MIWQFPPAATDAFAVHVVPAPETTEKYAASVPVKATEKPDKVGAVAGFVTVATAVAVVPPLTGAAELPKVMSNGETEALAANVTPVPLIETAKLVAGVVNVTFREPLYVPAAVAE